MIYEDPQLYNPGHALEGCDRCHTVQEMMNLLLNQHPAVAKVGGQHLVDSAMESIAELYQLIGALDDMRDAATPLPPTVIR